MAKTPQNATTNFLSEDRKNSPARSEQQSRSSGSRSSGSSYTSGSVTSSKSSQSHQEAKSHTGSLVSLLAASDVSDEEEKLRASAYQKFTQMNQRDQQAYKSSYVKKKEQLTKLQVCMLSSHHLLLKTAISDTLLIFSITLLINIELLYRKK